jgi:hypothetical protein
MRNWLTLNVEGIWRYTCTRPVFAAKEIYQRNCRAFVQSVGMCSLVTVGMGSMHIGDPNMNKSCHTKSSGRACVWRTEGENEH